MEASSATGVFSEGTLASRLDAIEPMRILGDPKGDRPLCIILLHQDLRRLPVWMRRRPHLRIAHILLADIRPNTEIRAEFPKEWGNPAISAGFEPLEDLTGCDKVFMYMPEIYIRSICMRLPTLAREKIWLAASHDPGLARRAPIADYYSRNAENLEKVWRLLATREDREVFARRVKALVTGDPGYLPMASHVEYDHPLVGLSPGDCLIDGGLSDMVGCQKGFAAKVGERGVIHGFEPIPWMAEKAREELRPFPWYRVHAFGLGAESGPARFASLRDSSHLAAPDLPDGVDCQLTTIDEFVAESCLGRVDAIKLDVEGAELAALRGAEHTIRSRMPKLIVCLYHKPEDLYEIPLHVHKTAPEYELRMAHSSCGFNDTILYASAPASKSMNV